MTAQHVADEAIIRGQIDKLVESIRAMDLEGAKSIYAPDIVTFDVGGPLQRVGAAAKGNNWEQAFAMFRRPPGYEFRGLTITLGADVPFPHPFARLSRPFTNAN